MIFVALFVISVIKLILYNALSAEVYNVIFTFQEMIPGFQ